MKGAAFVVLSCVIVAPLAAQGANCASAETQSDLNACASQASGKATRRLMDLLHELHASLDSTRLSGLDSAQADWERFRRSHCGWIAAGYEGGSIQPMMLSSCWAAVTERRIAELKPFLCTDEALSCEESRRYDLPPTTRRRP